MLFLVTEIYGNAAKLLMPLLFKPLFPNLLNSREPFKLLKIMRSLSSQKYIRNGKFG